MPIPDYGGIIAGVVNVMLADAALTSQLASYAPDGGTPSQENSIFSGLPPKDRAFPCVTLFDLMTGPALKRQHDRPFTYVAMRLQIDVWSTSELGRPIIWEIDNLLETAFIGGAMDTTDWQFDDIDTSGDWRTIDVPSEFVAGSEGLQQRSKVFRVKAASKS